MYLFLLSALVRSNGRHTLLFYFNSAVKSLHKSGVHFQNIQELLKNAMFMKQQIDYEEDRK